ncbi:hypothetical protein [Oryzicola mucosus]|uniref:Uncharacterized protein n=1 Tax=Oryzicola mucosus TaxID=2767425 RepID=A0A8J6PUU2_9HYPH|nr:hypothetical protein [Oryzicola mucosus]MBD0414593.1 hypothetical protein [Oryzicola mucosus]
MQLRTLLLFICVLALSLVPLRAATGFGTTGIKSAGHSTSADLPILPTNSAGLPDQGVPDEDKKSFAFVEFDTDGSATALPKDLYRNRLSAPNRTDQPIAPAERQNLWDAAPRGPPALS